MSHLDPPSTPSHLITHLKLPPAPKILTNLVTLHTFLQQNRILGFVVSALFWSASIATTLGISVNGKYGILINDLGGTDTFNDIYIKPYTRFGPYIIGLVAGYLLYDGRKHNRRHHPVTVLAWWTASAAMALAVIYGLRDYYEDPTNKPSKTIDVLYLTFSRSVAQRGNGFFY